MNQKLPRPLQNALARQAAGEVHPSPDLLTSFIERTLPSDERDVVASHLAQCPSCREVVLLASSAAEDVVFDDMQMVAGAHLPVPNPVYASAQRKPAALTETPRRRWPFFGLSWAAAAAAVLLAAGLLLWQRSGSVNLARPPVSRVASNNPPSGFAQPAPPGTPSASETLAKTTRATTTPPRSASAKPPVVAAGGPPGHKRGEEYPSEPNVAAAPADENAQTPVSVQGGPEVAAPVPATHNAFVQSQADSLSQFRQGTALARPMMSMQPLDAAHGRWRVSADGHLERRVAAGDWTRVLGNEATTFRAVCVVGGDVWAGGNSGALFHSHDDGQHWSRTPLVSSSGAETGTIVSIQFQDPQQGTVLTIGGSRWSTSDGGVTWTSR